VEVQVDVWVGDEVSVALKDGEGVVVIEAVALEV
jgi:hypothetical protein